VSFCLKKDLTYICGIIPGPIEYDIIITQLKAIHPYLNNGDVSLCIIIIILLLLLHIFLKKINYRVDHTHRYHQISNGNNNH
jgi:hypothetical protein